MLRNMLLAVLLSTSPALSAVAPATDSDQSVTTIKGWGRVIDPDADCNIRATPNGSQVSMLVPAAAHDFAAELERWNAPRVLMGVQGDFVAEVKVGGDFSPGEESTIEGRKSYNGAGLLVVADPQNHLSLQRGAFRTDDGHVRHYLNCELRRDGQSVVSYYSMDLRDQETYLRLERRGNQITASVSMDGLQWRSYKPINAPDLPRRLRIGVEAVNSANASFRCVFSDFALYHRINSPPVEINPIRETAAAR